MKKAKKIALVLTILALLCSVVICAFAADGIHTGTIEECQLKLSAVKGQSDVDLKLTAFKEACQYLWSVDPKSDGYRTLRKDFESTLADVAIAQLAAAAASNDAEVKMDYLSKVEVLLDGDENPYPAFPVDHEKYNSVMIAAAECVGSIAKLVDGVEEKTEFLNDAYDYFMVLPSATEGYDDVLALLDDVNVQIVSIYLETVRTTEDAAAKQAAFNTVTKWIANRPITETHAQYAPLNEGLADEALKVATGAADVDTLQMALDYAAEFLLVVPENSANYKTLLDTFNEQNFLLVKKRIELAENAKDEGENDDFATKEEQLVLAYNQIMSHPLVDKDGRVKELNGKIAEQALAVAENYVTEMNAAQKLADKSRVDKKQQSFLRKFKFETADGYGEYEKNYEEAMEAYAKLIQEAKDLVEKTIPLSEYETKFALWKADFDSVGTGKLTMSGSKGENDFVGMEEGKDGKNRYYTIRIADNSDPRVTIGASIVNPTIYEFDVTTFSNIQGGGIYLRGYKTATTNGKTAYPQVFTIKSTGDLYVGSAQDDGVHDGPCVSNIITAGEWTHLAFAIDPVECKVTLYYDYQKMCTHNAATAGGDLGTYTIPALPLRTGLSGRPGEVSFDNFIVYEGTAPRTFDRFDNMTEAEILSYASGIVADDTIDPYVRVAAKEYVKDIYAKFWGAATEGADPDYIIPADTPKEEADMIRAAVDAIKGFDDKVVMEAYKAETLAKFKEYIAQLEALGAVRAPGDNFDKREGLIKTIDKYLAARHFEVADGEIVGEDGKTTEKMVCETALANHKQFIENENAITEFCTVIQVFQGSSKAESMTNYYNQATQLLASLELSLLENPNFADFQEKYAVYLEADKYVEEAVRVKNSKDLIGYISQITDYTTEAEWEENYDDLKQFVLIIRAILAERTEEGAIRYNPDYPGVPEALAAFESINVYFYARFQEEHIQYIGEKLEIFLAASGYVEKMGICQVIENYIDSADIDESNEELAKLIATFRVYDAELDIQEGDYGALLDQNTQYFINMTEILKTCTSYTEKKAIYDEATVYYYAMNVGEAVDEIAYFEAIGDELELVEKASLAFIAATAKLSAAETEDEKFAALVECCYYLKSSDEEVDGVAIALQTYETEYAAYSAKINSANDDVVNGSYAVASVRGVCDVSRVVISVLNKIFAK